MVVGTEGTEISEEDGPEAWIATETDLGCVEGFVVTFGVAALMMMVVVLFSSVFPSFISDDEESV